MPENHVSTTTLIAALTRFWIRKNRIPLGLTALVLVVGASALLLWPSGPEGQETSVLKAYLARKGRSSRKAAGYKAPEKSDESDLGAWMKGKLPEKVRAEKEAFEVKKDTTMPEGMDPQLAEMEQMTVLHDGTRALEKKNYDEALLLYRQALVQGGDNSFVKAHAWGGIMEVHMQRGNKSSFKEALGQYSDSIHELGFAKPGEEGFSPLAMVERMESFSTKMDEYNQKIGEGTAETEIPKQKLVRGMEALNDQFQQILEEPSSRQ